MAMPKFCNKCSFYMGKVKNWKERILCSNPDLAYDLGTRYQDEYIVEGNIEVEANLRTGTAYLTCDHWEEREKAEETA